MKKTVFALLSCLFLIGFIGIASAGFSVEKEAVDNLVISEVGNQAIYDFTVKNTHGGESVEISTFTGATISPKVKHINVGETDFRVTLDLSSSQLKNNGFIGINYQIKGQESGEVLKDEIIVKVIDLEEVFEIKTARINIEDSSADIRIRNIQNKELEDVSFVFSSAFFEDSKTGSFAPFEEIVFSVPISKGDISNLVAGSYVLDAEVSYEGSKAEITGLLDYVEKENIVLAEENSGFFVRKTELKKTNEGNKVVDVSLTLKKNVLTRLFTTSSRNADEVDRQGLGVTYTWSDVLSPGESLQVTVRTNYTFPILILILIIVIGVGVRVYTLTNVYARKKVSFVKTRGGEFALRVRVKVKARKNVEDLKIVEHLPVMAKLYNKFGRSPDKVDKDSRRLTWNLGKLNAGEERSISYIVYSKIKTVGRFELPPATIIYKIDGKVEYGKSNRAYFVGEQTRSEL